MRVPGYRDATTPARSDASCGQSPTFGDRLRAAAKALWGSDENGSRPSEMIATLNEVAGAVSSAMNVDDVLDVIVERAKRLTGTDKAVLVLTDPHGEQLDIDTLVVRGCRAQHLQDWWESRLDIIGSRVFETGQPEIEAHPEAGALMLASPVLIKDRAVGLLCAINSQERPFEREHIDSLCVLSAFAATAIENAQLAEQSRYVLLASERDRIAREMHDGVVQSLFSISLGLELCKKQVFRDPAAVSVRLEELQVHLNTAMTELRRFIYDLRPMRLAELGLLLAVKYWVHEITQGRAVTGRVIVDGEIPRLSPAEEACLYRVAKEAVSNVVRHAQARNFEVRMAFKDGAAELSVSDDGIGFASDQVLDGGTQGLGLKSIQDRIVREGGSLTVTSSRVSGTILSVQLPVGVSA